MNELKTQSGQAQVFKVGDLVKFHDALSSSPLGAVDKVIDGKRSCQLVDVIWKDLRAGRYSCQKRISSRRLRKLTMVEMEAILGGKERMQ